MPSISPLALLPKSVAKSFAPELNAEAVYTAKKTAIIIAETILIAPVLGAALIVGLFVAIFQATTSIQEQTLAFIPKIVAVFVAILIFGPWMLRIMVEFVTNIFVNLPYYIG